MFSLDTVEGTWSLSQLGIPDFVDFPSEALPPLRSGCGGGWNEGNERVKEREGRGTV